MDNKRINLLFALGMLFFVACSSGSSSSSSGGSSTNDVTGTWKGRAYIGSYYVNITFTITQSGNSISGNYACFSGTDSCSVSSMTLSGTISGSSFTGAVTTTGGSCGFTGTVNGNSMGGSYSCNGGSSSTWNTTKQ